MRVLELIFTREGVELVDTDDDDAIVWSSDDDDDFREEFPDELLTPEKDGENVIAWLVENDVIDDTESDDIEIYDEFDDNGGNVIDGEVEEN